MQPCDYSIGTRARVMRSEMGCCRRRRDWESASFRFWRTLRRHDICLERRNRCISARDREFGPKAADVASLYLTPPQNTLVVGSG